MRKLLALAVLILTTRCALAENPRVFTSGGELVKLEALSGDLVLKGKMESEQPVFWFHLIFKNAAGKELFRMRLGDNQLIVPDNHGIAQLAEPLAAGETFTLKIHIARNAWYAAALNDYLQASFTTEPENGPCTVELEPFQCKVILDEVKWTADPEAKIEAVIRTYGKHMWDQVLGKTPEGDWELRCRFRPTRRNQENNHYGFQIYGDKNQPRLMLVIWDSLYQMIQGDNSKGLGNFEKSLNGEWHDFKLTCTDGNFFETFIDGKRGDSFEAELTPGGDVRVYGMWDLEIKDFEIVNMEE